MGKNKNLEQTQEQNLKLRGSNSIQIGIYIIIYAYLLETLLTGFINDNSFIMMLSIQIIETMSTALGFLMILFSGLAIFYSSRRRVRKQGRMIWNKATKAIAYRYFILFFAIFTSLLIFANNGFTSLLATISLSLIGFALASLNTKKRKEHYLLTGICLLLAVINFLIPNYWYSSFLILGASFFVYGVMVRE